MPQAVHKAAKEKPKFPGGQSFTFHHSPFPLFFSLHERKSVGFPSFFSFFWPLITVKKKTEGEGGRGSKKKNTPCFSPAMETGKNAFLFSPSVLRSAGGRKRKRNDLSCFVRAPPPFFCQFGMCFLGPCYATLSRFPARKSCLGTYIYWQLSSLQDIFKQRGLLIQLHRDPERDRVKKKIKTFFPTRANLCLFF